MPHSHHSHSGQFCAHAKGSLEAVVLEAIAQGFTLYGLSEHIPRSRDADLYPEEIAAGLTPTALSTQFSAYLDEAHRLKNAHKDEIELLVGLETELIHESDIEELNELLATHGRRIEYVVGSVHHVRGVPIDFDRPTFDRALAAFPGSAPPNPTDAFLFAYFDAQYQLIERVRPEVIGHADLCRLYTPDLRLRDHPAAWAKLERNVRAAAAYGALFECNAAALRKGWASPYPGPDVLQVILEHGGRLALSDDSHGPHAVGLNYARMRECLRAQGVRELWRLARAAEPNAAGRFVRAVRVEGEWWADPFWDAPAREG